MAGGDKVRVDIVVPVYNEEEAILGFHGQLRQVIDPLPYDLRIYYVDDGSTDDTRKLLDGLVREDERLVVVELSRNFGHQAALTAGLDLAQGKFVITMDGDGQHPPTMIPEMLRLAEAGYDIVITQRIGGQGGSLFKRWTSHLFYHLMNRLGDTKILPGTADFFLLERQVVQALQEMREHHRLLRGMVAWVGYRSVILPYQGPGRLAGRSKYSLHKMIRLGMNAIFSFSLVPLYIGLSVGVIFLLLAFAEMVYVLSFWISGRQASLVPGWSSLMFILLVVGGSLMITVGVIGIYIGYVFQEVKDRPIYLVKRQSTGATHQQGPT